MRTKTLLLTAALSAAGVAASMAQVYSVNVVGYVNVTVPKNGWAILANPLNNGANAFRDVIQIPDGFDGVTVFRYDAAHQTFGNSSTWFFGDWSGGDITTPLAPGEGFFIQNPANTDMVLTFVGEVGQGALSTSMKAGWNMVGSQVPMVTSLDDTTSFPADEGDTVFLFDTATQSYGNSYTFFFGAWDPAVPQVPIGKGFWINKTIAKNWARTFNVQ